MQEALTLPTQYLLGSEGPTEMCWPDIPNSFKDYIVQAVQRYRFPVEETIPSQDAPPSNTSSSLEGLISQFDINEVFPDYKMQTLLYELYNECIEANWDSYGAEPISHTAYYEAGKFLRVLPSAFPKPDILPEPDGSIGLDWYKDEESSFTVSITGNTIISYAGFFGQGNETFGSERFVGSLPKAVFYNLRRLFSETV